MKGIILAGGKGTRLYPVTQATCKQLLPVYDKPMIYYPLSVLMQGGIREILLITTPEDRPRFEALFGDGSFLGLEISYAEQQEANGIAQAFLIGASFIGHSPVCLILGDNIFYGEHLDRLLAPLARWQTGAMIFGYEVQDPSQYGVLDYDEEGNIADIVEKPLHPPSRYAVTGLYCYGPEVIALARTLRPSPRLEYEITDLNRIYLREGSLQVTYLDRGFAWLDTGTHEALQQASTYVQVMSARQGIQIACLEEIAFKKGFISADQLSLLSEKMPQSSYSAYLKRRSHALSS